MSRENSADNGRRFYACYGKRALDLAVSVPALMALSPALLVIAALVKAGGPGPVFYAQERVGRRGRPFRLYKFRTMVTDADKSGPAVTSSGDARITPLGRTLRKWKLDELPQLWNVVRGDMSLVGPRPEVPEYVAHYPAQLRERALSVRPGITSPGALAYLDESAQLARAADPEREYVEVILPRKVQLAADYAEHSGLWSDLCVLGRTLRLLVVR